MQALHFGHLRIANITIFGYGFAQCWTEKKILPLKMSKVIEDLIGNTATGTFCWHELRKPNEDIFRVEKVAKEKKKYDGIMLKIYYGSEILVTKHILKAL